MTEHPGYYAVIPAAVRYADIPDAAKLMYGEITALANARGYCWATNQYFAELYGRDERTVRRWVEALREAGFVTVVYGGPDAEHARRIYVATPDVVGADKNVRGGGQKCPGPPDKNVRRNSTENTTENTRGASPPSTDLSPLKDELADRFQTAFTARVPASAWGSIDRERHACNWLAKKLRALAGDTGRDAMELGKAVLQQYEHMRRTQGGWWKDAEYTPTGLQKRWSAVVGALAQEAEQGSAMDRMLQEKGLA